MQKRLSDIIGGSTTLRANGTILAPDSNGVVDLPSASKATNGVIPITIDNLRTIGSPSTDRLYSIVDSGKEGLFAYDPTDTTRPDDIGLCIVGMNNARFKRLVPGDVLISWFGIRGISTPNGGQDASLPFYSIIQLLNTYKLQDRWIVLEADTYKWDNYITTSPYTGRLCCKTGFATLSATNQNNILWFTTSFEVKYINFNGYTGDPVLRNGAVSQVPTDYTPYALVRLSAVCSFDWCSWNNSRGHGLYVDGNIQIRTAEFPTGSNSSCSRIMNFNFISNRGAGMYIESPLNQGGYDNNEVYTAFCNGAGFANNGWGYIDESFLGCRLVCTQFNENKFGHLRIGTTHGNSKGSAIGIYEEETNQDHPSEIGGYVIIEGRFNTVITTGNAVVRNGSDVSQLTTRAISIYAGDRGIRWQGLGDSAQGIRLHDSGETNITHMLWDSQASNYLGEFFQEAAILKQPSASYYRRAPLPGFAFPYLYLGREYKLHLSVDTINNFLLATIPFTIGDTIDTKISSTYPAYWVCVTGGNRNKMGANVSNGTTNLTASTNPGDGGQLTGSFNASTILSINDYITVNNTTVRITGFDTGNKIYIDNNLTIPNNSVVTYAIPAFRAYGDMAGLKSQMPTNLGAASIGIRYYATDPTENKEYRWNGTAFIAV